MAPAAPPPNREINEFQPGAIIIRTTNTGKKPFEGEKTAEIVAGINLALTVKDIRGLKLDFFCVNFLRKG